MQQGGPTLVGLKNKTVESKKEIKKTRVLEYYRGKFSSGWVGVLFCWVTKIFPDEIFPSQVLGGYLRGGNAEFITKMKDLAMIVFCQFFVIYWKLIYKQLPPQDFLSLLKSRREEESLGPRLLYKNTVQNTARILGEELQHIKEKCTGFVWEIKVTSY